MSMAISIPSGSLTASFIEKAQRAFQQKNIVLLPEEDYKEMLKTQRNAEYLAKLDRSFLEIEAGNTIAFDIEELEAMAAE